MGSPNSEESLKLLLSQSQKAGATVCICASVCIVRLSPCICFHGRILRTVEMDGFTQVTLFATVNFAGKHGADGIYTSNVVVVNRILIIEAIINDHNISVL